MKKMIKVLLPIILIVAVAVGVVLMPLGKSEKITDTVDNWMSNISDDTPLSAINIPGTHDSATKFVMASAISRTQNLSVYEQLQAGVRYFDFRFEKTETDIITVHDVTNCKTGSGYFADDLTAGMIVDVCRKFLEENPTETILFQFKEGDGDAGTTLYSEFYNRYIKGNESLWFTQNRIPEMGEVRGKIVMLRVVSVDGSFDDTNSGINFENYPYVGSTKLYDYRRCEITDLNNIAYAQMYVQDSYKLGVNDKWTAIKDFIESDLSDEEFNICLTSSSKIPLPYFIAKQTNKNLSEYEFENGKVYGIIATDFITQEICEKIYSTNY